MVNLKDDDYSPPKEGRPYKILAVRKKVTTKRQEIYNRNATESPLLRLPPQALRSLLLFADVPEPASNWPNNLSRFFVDARLTNLRHLLVLLNVPTSLDTEMFSGDERIRANMLDDFTIFRRMPLSTITVATYHEQQLGAHGTLARQIATVPIAMTRAFSESVESMLLAPDERETKRKENMQQMQAEQERRQQIRVGRRLRALKQ
ncbi:hypothetical protein B0A55_10345 [Friedmanniomyces simplex]|uniref:Uncharacterized protein n=1 Tax=Friedmanniomyces simplex TaxID=329884 RepID=A0A4U0WPI5_9PEZI|nr:hypothetical protein B0A55_10345 [Friedmanniomyces simplex]